MRPTGSTLERSAQHHLRDRLVGFTTHRDRRAHRIRRTGHHTIRKVRQPLTIARRFPEQTRLGHTSQAHRPSTPRRRSLEPGDERADRLTQLDEHLIRRVMTDERVPQPPQ